MINTVCNEALSVYLISVQKNVHGKKRVGTARGIVL